MKDGTYIARVDENGIPTLAEPVAMSDGYWVSDDTGVSVHGKLDPRGLVDALHLMDIQTGEIVGVWENDGLSYIDRSYHFQDKEEAIKAAEAFEQIAIWDCNGSEEVRL